MDELTGQQLGQYHLYNVIGKGGMATVYRARQTSIGRDVAVKVLSPELVGNEEFITRFEREARIIAGLQHPHILTVYDFGREGRLVYLVMRLLSGGSLAKELKNAGQLTLPRVLTLVRQIAVALDYAHVRGIVHRDLKPTNVLLDEDGNAYLTDFGIAKMVSQATVSGLTQPGSVMGTPSYMAPEQWRSEPVDGRTDIYALGIMAYQMLVGHVPFHAETPHGLMYLHLDRDATPLYNLLPNLPRGIDRAIQRALAKDPNLRYASAPDFAHDLEQAVMSPGRYQTGQPQRPGSGSGETYEFAEHDLMSRASEDELDRTVIPPGAPRRPSEDDIPARPPDMTPAPPSGQYPSQRPAQRPVDYTRQNTGGPQAPPPNVPQQPPRPISRPLRFPQQKQQTPPSPTDAAPLDQPAVRAGPQPRYTPPNRPPQPTGQQTGFGQPTGYGQGHTGTFGMTGQQDLSAEDEVRNAVEISGDNPVLGCLRVIIMVVIGLALFAGVVFMITLALKAGGDDDTPGINTTLPAPPTATIPATLTEARVAPTLQIVNPAGEVTVNLGAVVPIEFVANSSTGVTQVELRRFGQVLETRTFVNLTDVRSTFNYQPDTTGLHIVEVVAYSGAVRGTSVQITVRVLQ